MLNFNINPTSLAMILWSGMLIISGSIWVLSSQVRKLADLLEVQQARTGAPKSDPLPALRVNAGAGQARVMRRGTSTPVRRVVRSAPCRDGIQPRRGGPDKNGEI